MNLDKIIKEKYNNELRAPFKDFGGCILPTTFERFCERIKRMEVRNDDVWVTSFPKSGTTWCQEMVWLIGNDFDYKGAEKNLNERFPFLEISSLLDYNTYKNNHPEFKCPDYVLDPVTFADGLPSPRYIKTHLPWNLLPSQIKSGTKKPKIIHTMRNPKDVLVSWYHHTTLLRGFTGSLEEFFHLFLNDKMDYSPYFVNVLSYWNSRHLDNLLIITYEEMQKDLINVVKKVAKFVGKVVPDGEMPKLLTHLSFEEMKKNRSVNNEIIVDVLKLANVFKVPEKKFIRSGKCGSYKECFTREMISTMDEWCAKKIKGTGLNFEQI